MKKQKLLRNLNSKGRLLALLLTVTTSLLYCSSAWAWEDPSRALVGVTVGSDDYFVAKWKSSDSDQFSCENYPGGSYKGSFHEKDLGTITSNKTILSIVWVNRQNQSYSSGIWRYWVDDGSKTDKSFSKKNNYNGWCDGHYWDKYESATMTLKPADYSAGEHWFKCVILAPWNNTIWFNNGCNECHYAAKFTIPGWSTTSKTYTYAGTTKVGVGNTQTITLSTHYGSDTGIKSVSKSGDNQDDFTYVSSGSTTSSIKVTFTPSGTGLRTAVLTIKDKYDKTYTLTVKGTGISNTTPTVLIAGKESVDSENVTLNGYIKYTGCETVSSYGFVYGLDEGGEPTYDQQAVAGTSDVPAGTDFSTTFAVQESGTYNYRAYMTTSGGTYYSEERRQFTVDIDCDIITTVNATFEDNKTESSATYVDGSASIGLKTTNHAKDFLWECITKPDDADVTFTPAASSRIATVEVTEIGDYTFRLKGRCETGVGEYVLSETLTLYVCAPAEETQLYLDNHTVNVICVGEEATATCITKEGYTYALYNPDGESLGSLAGTGGKQTWRHVNGAGVFTMRTSPTSMPECAAVVSSATQSYNEPTLEITADPGLSVISYQPVTLSKKDVTSDTYVDTNPTWVISTGSDKGYLLNEHNRLAYDNRARESVVFKGGAADAATIKVQASAYKTVNVTDPDEKVENYTKQCPTTTEVTLTVSPAVDDCPQP